MAEAWEKLKEKVKDKRTKTGLQGNQRLLLKEKN
jgi:hypothetical protein